MSCQEAEKAGANVLAPTIETGKTGQLLLRCGARQDWASDRMAEGKEGSKDSLRFLWFESFGGLSRALIRLQTCLCRSEYAVRLRLGKEDDG